MDYDTAPDLAMDREGREFAYDSALYVTFDQRPVLDELLSYGWRPGEGPEKFTISKKHKRFKELLDLGRIEGDDPDAQGMALVSKSDVPHYVNRDFITIRRRGTDIMDQLANAPEVQLCEHPAGQRCNIVPSGSCHKNRFRRQYEDWKKGLDSDGADGLPLAQVPFIDAARREQLKRTGVRTAEQLVGLAEDVASRMPGTLALQERTRRFLAAVAGQREDEKLAAKLSERDKRIDELEKRLADLVADSNAKVPEPVQRAQGSSPARR